MVTQCKKSYSEGTLGMLCVNQGQVPNKSLGFMGSFREEENPELTSVSKPDPGEIGWEGNGGKSMNLAVGAANVQV